MQNAHQHGVSSSYGLEVGQITGQNVHQDDDGYSENLEIVGTSYNHDYRLDYYHGIGLGTLLIGAIAVFALIISIYNYLAIRPHIHKSIGNSEDNDLLGDAIDVNCTGLLRSDSEDAVSATEFKREIQALETRMNHTLKENHNDILSHIRHRKDVEIHKADIPVHVASVDDKKNHEKRDELAGSATVGDIITEICTEYCTAEKGTGKEREDFYIKYKKLYSERMYDFGLKSPDDSYDRSDYSFREFIIAHPSSSPSLSMILFLLSDGEIGLILPKFHQALFGNSSFTKAGCHKFFKVDSWHGSLYLIQPAIVKLSPCKTIVESIEQDGKIG